MRNGECMQGEAQSLEYFRYARNRSFVAELIRERFNTPNDGGQRREHSERPAGAEVEMSKRFWAENRATGERWTPEKGKTQYLVMYDSGYLAVVTEDFYQYVRPLDTTEWRCVLRQKRET